MFNFLNKNNSIRTLILTKLSIKNKKEQIELQFVEEKNTQAQPKHNKECMSKEILQMQELL